MSEINVTDLKFPDNVRKRLGMYLGSPEHPTKSASEVADNGIDEIIAGYGTKVHVHTTEKTVLIIDDGRGVPVYEKFDKVLKDGVKPLDAIAAVDGGADPSEFYDIVPTGWTAARSVWGSLHSGGKFENDAEATVGMNGVGASCANATSQVFIGYVNLNKKVLDDPKRPTPQWLIDAAKSCTSPIYKIEFHKGHFFGESVVELDDIEPITRSAIAAVGDDTFGTVVYFEPDPEIWDSVAVKFGRSLLRVARMQFDESVEILINGREVDPYELSKHFDKTTFVGDRYFEFEGDASNDKTIAKFKVQFGYSGTDFDYRYDGSVNTIKTPEGFHIRSVQRGIGKAIAQLHPGVTASDAKYGLRMFTLFSTNFAVFNSQTKENLTTVTGLNQNHLIECIAQSLIGEIESNKEMAKVIKLVVERIIEYKRQLGNMSIKQSVEAEIKTSANSRGSNGMGTKVWDCSSRDRSKCELFIVEGDSAAGSLVQAPDRDTRYHAILPLRGKPMNTSTRTVEEMLENEEMKSLFNVLGAGIHPYNVDMESMRYGKVFLFADEDADGKQILALLLGAFGVYLPQAVQEGRVYIIDTPLYEQGGKFFRSSEKHMLDESKPFARFKGLGAMNPDEIDDFAFNGETRSIIQVTSEGLQEAIDLIRNRNPKRKLVVDAGLVADE